MQTVSRVKKPSKKVIKTITVEDSKRITIKDAIEEFLTDRSVVSRCRPRSVANYQLQLTVWAKYALETQSLKYLQEVTPANLKDYVIYLTRDKVCSTGANRGKVGLSVSAVNTVIVHLKTFYNYCYKQGLTDENPAEPLKRQRSPIDTFDVFTDQQVRKLLNCPDTTSFCGLRDYTIMLLFIDTGIRLGELLSLDVSDIDWDNEILILKANKTKNGRPRILPISKKTIQSLRVYIANRPPEVSSSVLWCTYDGKEFKWRALFDRISDYGKSLGLEGVRVSPHTFRHYFAKTYLMNGGDPFSLQKLLGHSSMDMTRVYVQMASCDVKSQHRKFTPVNKIL